MFFFKFLVYKENKKRNIIKKNFDKNFYHYTKKK